MCVQFLSLKLCITGNISFFFGDQSLCGSFISKVLGMVSQMSPQRNTETALHDLVIWLFGCLRAELYLVLKLRHNDSIYFEILLQKCRLAPKSTERLNIIVFPCYFYFFMIRK